jgi:hypothetical protein
MQCDEARSLLFEYVDDLLSDPVRARTGDHLDGCPGCLADYQSIRDLQLQARVWHDVTPPSWQPPRIARPFPLGSINQWFPMLASAAALLIVVIMYFSPPAATSLGAAQPAISGVTPSLPVPGPRAGMPVAYSDPTIDALFSTNRSERQQELQALVQLMRAEMDRRNEETEASIRYVISHQIQGQREIDDLYQYIQKIGFTQPPAREQM